MTKLKDTLKAQEDDFKNRFLPIKKHYGNPPEDATEEILAWYNKAIIEVLDAVMEEIIGEDEDVDLENNYLDDPEVLVPESANSLRQQQRARYTTLKKELEK